MSQEDTFRILQGKPAIMKIRCSWLKWHRWSNWTSPERAAPNMVAVQDRHCTICNLHQSNCLQ